MNETTVVVLFWAFGSWVIWLIIGWRAMKALEGISNSLTELNRSQREDMAKRDAMGTGLELARGVRHDLLEKLVQTPKVPPPIA